MTYDEYCVSPVFINDTHDVIIDGLKVECNTLGCNYTEYFPTNDDATIGAEVHGTRVQV